MNASHLEKRVDALASATDSRLVDLEERVASAEYELDRVTRTLDRRLCAVESIVRKLDKGDRR